MLNYSYEPMQVRHIPEKQQSISHEERRQLELQDEICDDEWEAMKAVDRYR